jgi:hypothetical protein
MKLRDISFCVFRINSLKWNIWGSLLAKYFYYFYNDKKSKASFWYIAELRELEE